jgi:hypothetical protein
MRSVPARNITTDAARVPITAKMEIKRALNRTVSKIVSKVFRVYLYEV